MSDDLVKRLRGWARDIREGSTATWAMDQDLKSAADRIEELEAELAEAKRHLEKMLVWSDDLSLQCAEIRPKFREDYNNAAGFLDGDDDNG